MMRLCSMLIALLALAFVSGYLWFVYTIPEPADADQHTDAIVVLTGGSGRIKEGESLLAQGLAPILYISGVHPEVDKAMLFKGSTVLSPVLVRCCVILEHLALDTRDNAAQTAKWAQDAGLKSIRLVTADYHMRRSLLEFRQYLPTLQIIAHPIKNPDVQLHERWRAWPTFKVLVLEYAKWLVAYANWLWAQIQA